MRDFEREMDFSLAGFIEICAMSIRVLNKKISLKYLVCPYQQRIASIVLCCHSLHVDGADPRPVHDRVPHMDRHHIRSSPDGARPVHEWIHRCTSGTRPARLRHEFFHTLNIDVHRS